MTQDTKEYWAKELYFWQHSNTNSFNQILFSLIAKADVFNLERLTLGFSIAVSTYFEWYTSETEESFYTKYNLGDY